MARCSGSEAGQRGWRCLAGGVDLADPTVGLQRAAQHCAGQRSPVRLFLFGAQDVSQARRRSLLGRAPILQDEVGEGGQLAPVAASGNRHDLARRVIHPTRGYAARYAHTAPASRTRLEAGA